MKTSFLNLLLICLLTNFSFAQQPSKKPLEVSGVYPSFAAFNSPADRARPNSECGIGQLVNWAGKLWYTSYTSHDLFEGTDKLHFIDKDYKHNEYEKSVGGTSSCRMIHKESEQLIIASYFIDKNGNIRTVPRKELPGRLTAVSRDIRDPANKVLFLTQEGSVYEVDVHTLKVTFLFKKPAVGWHAKGAYTSQGVFVVTNNGEDSAPTPFWNVDYSDPWGVYKREEEVKDLFLTSRPKGPEDWGSLCEWDGKAWKLIKRGQYLDVTGPGGMTGAKTNDEQIWSYGWDKRSLLLSVREKGSWKHYRMLKPTYTFENRNGSNTEWPRINEVQPNKYLMFMNGAIYNFPGTFSQTNTSGIRPVCSMLRTVTDMAFWDNRLVFSCQETSWHGIKNLVPGQPNSNLIFTSLDQLRRKGPAIGYGGVWKDDYVEANKPSEALNIAGYDYRMLYLNQVGKPVAKIRIEVDEKGNDQWKTYETIELKGGEQYSKVLPYTLKAEWIRFTSDGDIKATAYVHAYSNRNFVDREKEIFKGLSSVSTKEESPKTIIRAGFPTRNLQYLVTDAQGNDKYYEVNEYLQFIPQNEETKAIELLKTAYKIVPEIMVDEASVMVKGGNGVVYRLPKGDKNFDNQKDIRSIREVVQERLLANLHGTFYEIPRGPEISRIKPVATHNFHIQDFETWRGLIVLSGVSKDAQPDGHIFKSADNSAGLWFGELDDLWKLGKPVGVGGPWKNSEILANSPSDPYLMTGYDKKSVEFSHDSPGTVKFFVEVDYFGKGEFFPSRTFEIPAGRTVRYEFPEGFSAHWIRLIASKECKATAIFTYQ
jgi:hypothetical protein